MTYHIPILLAGILTFAYIISDRFSAHSEKYHRHFLSLGSGMLITLIILQVFPQLFGEGVSLLGNLVYIGVLAGFVIYHLFEKYIYQLTAKRQQLVQELGYLHVVGFLVDNFIDGFILVLLFGLAIFQNYLILLLFLPLLLSNIAESITLRHISDKFKLSKPMVILLALTNVIGAIVATVLNFDKAQFYSTLSVLTGILVYFIVRDEIPSGKEGKPLFFIIGVVIISVIVLSIKPVG